MPEFCINSVKRTFIMIVITLFTFNSNSFSQQNSKPHYQIINPNNEDELHLIKALTHTDLDPYRFIDSRRLVAIEGSTIQLELYSGNELKELYGKEISQNNKNSAGAGKITLKIVSKSNGLTLVPTN